MQNPIKIPIISLAIVLLMVNLTSHKDAKSELSLLSNSKSQSDSLDQQVALTALLKPLKLSVYLDKPVKSKTVLIYIFISQSTNVEVNPGPVVSQYPCGYCNLEVTWSQKGIYCEECGIWYHTDCQGIGDGTYDKLSESKHVWICLNCCLPNYSSSLLESLDSLADTNSFSSLESDRLDEASASLLTNDSNINTPNSPSNTSRSGLHQTAPRATSTPKPPKTKTRNQKQKSQSKERITILNINCRSLKNKIPELHQVIDQTKPDIIACTETWLKPDISSSEIFPNSFGYTIIRDDRLTRNGGGVLLAISKRLTCEEQPDLKSDCNATWAKITIKGVRTIYVSSFYKPIEDDEKSLSELWKSTKKIPQNSISWILGDFNMPGIDWSNESIKHQCKFKLSILTSWKIKLILILNRWLKLRPVMIIFWTSF